MSRFPLRKSTDINFDVTGASQLVLPANEHRRYAVLVNNSNADIFIRLGSAAVANEGIPIYAGGFAYEITNNNLWLGDIFAIHGAGGTKRLCITEMS